MKSATTGLHIPQIGLEVHAQLMTDSKIFCGCAVRHDAPPNSLTCPVCLGLPGALPVLNRRAVTLAMRAIAALGGKINDRSTFARKNYFYPDLPKGYQITQYDQPLGEGGQVEFELESGEKHVCRIARIHLEEDAGKLLHPEDKAEQTLVDLNRCGAPLVEIVSAPDLQTAEQAYAYLAKLKQILQWLSVCTGDMEKGHLRCDANVSVRISEHSEPGTRTEIKNLNSFRAVRKALEYEVGRQKSVLNERGAITQDTLLWDEKNQRTEIMRSKEESEDYRYFPEPDLRELVITDAWRQEVLDQMLELPDSRAVRFAREFGIREYDARVLTANRELADFFEDVAGQTGSPTTAANWIQTDLLGILKGEGLALAECRVSPEMLAELLQAVDSGEISASSGKEVLLQMVRTGKRSTEIIAQKGLTQITDEATLRSEVDRVLAANESGVQSYRAGKTTILAHFVGQVMKATQGRANPEIVNRILKERLEGN